MNFSIFEDAETKSAIVFHVRLIWVQNEASKGGEFEVFGWKVYINFNTFGEVKSEAAIIFQVRPLSKAKMGLEIDDKVQCIRFE